MRTLLTTILLVLALPAAAGAAATDPGAQPDPRILDGSAQRELDAARASWAAFAPAHYRMRIATDCFCAPRVRRARRIEVRDGRPVAPPPAHLHAYATARRLFARVQEAIDERVARLTVAYDRHGLPRTLFVDVSTSIADEEHGVRVLRFRALS